MRPCEQAPITIDWSEAMASLGANDILGCGEVQIEHDISCLGSAGELTLVPDSYSSDIRNMTTSGIFTGGSLGEQYKVTFWVRFRACNGQESQISECVIVNITNC